MLVKKGLTFVISLDIGMNIIFCLDRPCTEELAAGGQIYGGNKLSFISFSDSIQFWESPFLNIRLR
jgi:hypothetical protein